MKEIITDTDATVISVSTTITPGYRLVCIDMHDGSEKDAVILTERREVEAMITALQNSLNCWDDHQAVN